MVASSTSNTRWPGPGAARRLRVLLAQPGRGARTFVSHPQPQAIGSYRRGRQIMAGNLLFAGALVEHPASASVWEVDPPSDAFARTLHSFEWLEDIAAIGDVATRETAQAWTLDWIARFGTGKGPGWTPAVTGRRLVRLITHAPMLLMHMPSKSQGLLFHSLSRQTLFLRREWPRGPEGLARIEALTGLIYAGLTLEGYEPIREAAVKALGRTVAACVMPDGGVASRNPDELLEVFTLLGWVKSALSEGGKDPVFEIEAALQRIAPTLRVLRHVDGQLARFHGGSGGAPGQLDKALVLSGIRTPATKAQAMGYDILHHGRTTVIVDAATPPVGDASGVAHASTLAFELNSDGRGVIVNCGPGHGFGPDWARAGRATASHSTMGLERYSSARIGPEVMGPEGPIAPLVQTPHKVIAQKSESRKMTTLIMSHDGYARGHGLTHLRRLALSLDGRMLAGEDSLRALSRADKAQFDRVLDASGLEGIALDLRFHLHPDTEADVDLGGRAVSIQLPNSEIWIFRPGEGRFASLVPSVYLDPARLKPRATKQIVLSDRLVKYAATIDWTLTKAQDAHVSPDT